MDRHGVPSRPTWVLEQVFTLPVLLCAALVGSPLFFVLAQLLVPGGEAWTHLRSSLLLSYIINTVSLMTLTGLGAVIIGVSTAWLVTATEFPGRRLLRWMLVLPLAAPAYIVAYLYTDLLEVSGPVQSGLRALTGWQVGDYFFPSIRSIPGAALVLSLVLYPYVYLLASAAFAARSGAHFEAARSLGLGPWAAFWRISLPMARPAIAGGVALVLMETLADFGVADYFAIPTFSTGIFRVWFAMGDKAAALRLAGLMLVFVVALVLFESLSRRGRTDSGERTLRHQAPLILPPGLALCAILVCALPVTLGFLLPNAVLASYTLAEGGGAFRETFLNHAANSITVATLAALCTTLIAFMLAYAHRQMPTFSVRSMIRVSTLGYALPGTLLAIALLGPIGNFDRWLTGFLSGHLGWTGGLILSGTLLMLLYAYIVRFLTVSYNSIHGGYDSISPKMDEAARSLGATPSKRMSRIHIPLLRPSLLAAGLLVFVDVMRELPATLILRPFNFETLATRVYRLASDERLAEASTAALAIVLVGLVPSLLLSRAIHKA